jgi:hypothetical protein
VEAAPVKLAAADPVRCSRCNAVLPREVVEAREMALCPDCGAAVTAWVFPAILSRPAPILSAETTAVEGDATCFFHPGKAAVLACSRCGRFVCQLCQVELRGETLCPECITTGMAKKKIAALENRRVCYDSVALTLATWPVVTLWYLTIFTAPAALYIGIRYWKAPLSIVGRTKVRLVLALLLATTEIALWVWGVLFLIAHLGTKS